MQLAYKEARRVFLYYYMSVHQSLLSLQEYQVDTQSLKFWPVYMDFRVDTIVITKFSTKTHSLYKVLQVLRDYVHLV
jgi:hypothetical protein